LAGENNAPEVVELTRTALKKFRTKNLPLHFEGKKRKELSRKGKMKERNDEKSPICEDSMLERCVDGWGDGVGQNT